jgi:hypothetical protein
MPLLLIVLAVPAALIGFDTWQRADGVLQQILAAVFVLTSAVLLGASFITDRVQLGNRKIVEELKNLRLAMLRNDAERHVRETDQAQALNRVR